MWVRDPEAIKHKLAGSNEKDGASIHLVFSSGLAVFVNSACDMVHWTLEHMLRYGGEPWHYWANHLGFYMPDFVAIVPQDKFNGMCLYSHRK